LLLFCLPVVIIKKAVPGGIRSPAADIFFSADDPQSLTTALCARLNFWTLKGRPLLPPTCGWPVYLADEMRVILRCFFRPSGFVQCGEEKLHQHDSDMQQTEDNGGFPAVSSSTVKRRPLTTAF
jgi:hypothetical protein